MLLLSGAAGWILLAASSGELAGWPHAQPGQPPAAQSTAASGRAEAYTEPVAPTTFPAGASAPAWPRQNTAARYDPSVQPAAYEQAAAGNSGNGEPDAARAAAPGPVPITPRSEPPSLPLKPPDGASSSETGSSATASVVTMVASLGLVLGIFLLTAWGIRRAAPQAIQSLPKEAFEVLGRAPLAGRQHAHLLRLGNKLVLVSLTPAGAETLAEIIDPVEVDRVAGLCRENQSGSASAAFRQVLGQFATGRTTPEENQGLTRPTSAVLGTAARYRTEERPHG